MAVWSCHMAPDTCLRCAAALFGCIFGSWVHSISLHGEIDGVFRRLDYYHVFFSFRGWVFDVGGRYMRWLRTVLSLSDTPPAAEVVHAGLVQTLVGFLRTEGNGRYATCEQEFAQLHMQYRVRVFFALSNPPQQQQ